MKKRIILYREPTRRGPKMRHPLQAWLEKKGASVEVLESEKNLRERLGSGQVDAVIIFYALDKAVNLYFEFRVPVMVVDSFDPKKKKLGAFVINRLEVGPNTIDVLFQ